jgi:hypothetical protein
MFNPKYVTIGKDVKHIEFKNNYIIKEFKNKKYYNDTLEFYKYFNNDFIPKLIDYDYKKITIKQENVGNLLSLKTNLPKDWKEQLKNMEGFFIKNNIFVEDIRFLPYTPLVINNLTVKNNKIYLVDLTMYNYRSRKYIKKKINNLIKNIEFYLNHLEIFPFIFILLYHIITFFYFI